MKMLDFPLVFPFGFPPISGKRGNDTWLGSSDDTRPGSSNDTRRAGGMDWWENLNRKPMVFLPFYHEIDRGFPVDFPQQTNPMRMGEISGIPSGND